MKVKNKNEMRKASSMMDSRCPHSYIPQIALPTNFKLSEEFGKCLHEIQSCKNVYITGEPGTGKTALLVYWISRRMPQ